ncbi:MAG: YtxH domain-containing protein [Actinomycetia bacterium]|nr:YtxH domain-containing protein [Actinomycetes bacterium]
MKNQRVFTNLLLTFGLGVIAGILFAPRSGEKTRKILAERAEQSIGCACTTLIDKMAMLKGRIGEYLEDMKEKVEDAD